MGWDNLDDVLATLSPTEGQKADGDQSVAESSEASTYFATPLFETDEDGTITTEQASLWLHIRIRWQWFFVAYKSDSWAWVTETKDPKSKKVVVDKIRANLRHRDCQYGEKWDERKNSSTAHAFLRMYGLGVCQSGVCGDAVAEKGFTRWSTKEVCA